MAYGKLNGHMLNDVTCRVWIPWGVFFVPGNRESGNVIPGRPEM